MFKPITDLLNLEGKVAVVTGGARGKFCTESKTNRTHERTIRYLPFTYTLSLPPQNPTLPYVVMYVTTKRYWQWYRLTACRSWSFDSHCR